MRQHTARTRLIAALIFVTLFLDLYANHRNLNPVWSAARYTGRQSWLKPILEDNGCFRVFADPGPGPRPNHRDTILKHHIMWQMQLMPNLGILRGIRHVGGITGLELRYQYLITELLKKPWRERIRFLRLANVKYIISREPLDSLPELKGEVERVSPLVFRLKDTLPRAWIVGALAPLRKGLVEELVTGPFDPRNSALARGKILSRYKQPGKESIGEIRYENGDYIRIRVSPRRPGVLVLSESAYPGWRVFVDGRERKCLWLDLLFQGVEISPGSHRVEFIYRPEHLGIYMIISLISLTVFLVSWAWVLLRPDKRQPHRQPPYAIRENPGPKTDSTP